MDKHQQQQQFKSDIVNASLVLNNQLTRLRMLDKKFTAMNTDLRNQIAANIKSGNNDRAKAIANELANIRHVQRTTQNMSLALEVVVIRFSTINEFAIILETINPKSSSWKIFLAVINRSKFSSCHQHRNFHPVM